MHLYAVPLIFILIGLAMYVVLGGADFGAGIWQLTAGGGADGARIRDHAHEAMAPVWEANHVWLIFVLTVLWTAYPTAFGSIASTLSVPLFIAGLGIIFRGAAYALRSGATSHRQEQRIDTVFAISSLLTPFTLGTAVGAIAARRVPVGNASGHLISSWTGPVSILIGAIAVATSAYLAAVFLSADAVRRGEADLARRFRTRALIAGTAAGGLAVGGLVVIHSDAHRVYHGLTAGNGLPALIISIVAGLAAVGLVLARRFEPARYTAALAVAAVIAGWALAQDPVLLPGLTIAQAAAPHDTLVLVTVAVIAGGALLFPSLALLFALLLRGTFALGSQPNGSAAGPGLVASAARAGLAGRAAVACLVAGVGLVTFADAPWAHAIGVTSLLAVIVLGVIAVAPDQLARGHE
jgi:cytochrome d ubiquinol oxidase subunit II